MASADPRSRRPGGGQPAEAPVSALPSARARAVAFLAICVAGLCGGLIGYSFVDLSCDGNCGTARGLGAVVGAALAAGGVAVVAVLTLRAMGEWRTMAARDEVGPEEG